MRKSIYTFLKRSQIIQYFLFSDNKYIAKRRCSFVLQPYFFCSDFAIYHDYGPYKLWVLYHGDNEPFRSFQV